MDPSVQIPFPQPASLRKPLRTSIDPNTAQDNHLSRLALEVVHNLRHQHAWTRLRLHKLSPLNAKPLPRPLISGLPPRRIYVHPDHQIEELKEGLGEKDVKPEREWILPTRLREKWSLRKFAEIFDAVTEEPIADGEGVESIGEAEQPSHTVSAEKQSADLAGPRQDSQNAKVRRARVAKRVLLATVADDSTVAYYIVHDGIVKPRQN